MADRIFHAVFAASAFSHLGTGVYGVAFPRFATHLTREPFLIGVVAMAPELPWLFFSIPAGFGLTGCPPRRSIVLANLMMAGLTVTVVALAWMALSGIASMLVLAGLAFMLGSVEVLRDNAAQTFLPDGVAVAALGSTNAVLQSSETLARQFISPPWAGAMIAGSIALPFAFQTLMFAISAALMVLALVRQWEKAAVADF